MLWGGETAAAVQTSGWVFNPTTNQWSAMQASGAPEARTAFGSACAKEKVYVWGGGDSSAYNTTTTIYNSGGVYDPGTDTWETLPTAGAPKARKNPILVALGNKVFVLGGNCAAPGVMVGACDSFGILDIESKTWTEWAITDAIALDHLVRISPGHGVVNGTSLFLWGGANPSNLFTPLADGLLFTPP